MECFSNYYALFFSVGMARTWLRGRPPFCLLPACFRWRWMRPPWLPSARAERVEVSMIGTFFRRAREREANGILAIAIEEPSLGRSRRASGRKAIFPSWAVSLTPKTTPLSSIGGRDQQIENLGLPSNQSTFILSSTIFDLYFYMFQLNKE